MATNSQRDYFVSQDKSENNSLSKVVDMAINKRKWLTKARRLFEHLDTENNGKLDENKFVNGLFALDCDKTLDELSHLFLR